jgi:hypothetical protein
VENRDRTQYKPPFIGGDMTIHRSRTLLAILVAVTLLAGCNLPSSSTPTPDIFLTPNLTMTAIFNQPVPASVPPTVTPGPEDAATNTPQVKPSNTSQPSPTVGSSPTPLVRTAIPTEVVASPTSNRPGVTASFLSSAPKIDGVWDEWKTTQYPLRSVVFGAKAWKNAADLSAAYRIGWDDNNLYIAVKVTDNKYVQNASGADLYKGDSLDLLFDAVPGDSTNATKLNDKDFQLGISPGKGEVGKDIESYLWLPEGDKGALSKVQVAAVSMPNGYRIEAAIPWATFGVKPADGQQYGFALSISDNDQEGKSVQEKMISTAPDRVLDTPSTWGVLTLSK